MSSKYAGLSFHEIERKLLLSLDDLCHRIENDGAPLNRMTAALDGTLEIENLTHEIKELARRYQSRLVLNRFRLAPMTPQVGALMIDPDRPPVGQIDYVRQIAQLVRDGKVITQTEFDKYKLVFDRHSRWKWRGHLPDPVEISHFVVRDNEPLDSGRRPAHWPSVEDEGFFLSVLSKARRRGVIAAADADRYEEIAKSHPEWSKCYPARIRGAERKRLQELFDAGVVSKALNRKWKR